MKPVPVDKKMMLVDFDGRGEPSLASIFVRAGFDVQVTKTKDQILSRITSFEPHIVLFSKDRITSIATSVCTETCQLVSKQETAIVFVSEDSSESSILDAFEAGADEYVIKPFSEKELLARIDGMMRRLLNTGFESSLAFADIEIDMRAMKVTRSTTPIHLGPAEFSLLVHFVKHPNWICSREKLCRVIHGHDAPIDLRSIDVNIRRLRKAININGLPNLIHTARASGYYLGQPV